MAQSGGDQALANALNELKRRSGYSYEQIGNRAHLGRSTVHRYCNGQSVPAEFAAVEQLAKVCGADREELSRLYRLWEQAHTARQSSNEEPEPPESDTGSAPEEPDTTETRRRKPHRRWWLLTAALASVLVLIAYAALSSGDTGGAPFRKLSGPNWAGPPKPVSPHFIGVTKRGTTGHVPDFPVGSLRFWQTKTRWQNLEPERGRFDWTVLDPQLTSAAAGGMPVLLTFGGTPGWAAPNGTRSMFKDDSRNSPPDDLADWDRFVREVAIHGKGRIESYELWDMGNPPFFDGSMETLVDMTRVAGRAIRETDPAATIVCPGFTTLWDPGEQQAMQRFAELGGYGHCDFGGVKMNPRNAWDPPETMVELNNEIVKTLHRARIGPPLWNMGWGYEVTQQNRVEPELSADYAVRFYLISLWFSYDRAYFYNWGSDDVPIVLQPQGFQPTKAGLFVGELQRWLTGAEITGCAQGELANLPENVWQCRFLREGRPFLIRWTHEGTARTTPDPDTTTIRHLDGTTSPVPPDEPVEITGRPILLELS